jgi:glyoxylase-like metal-dependent hydrolase (beta-lactamase superfamily II)
MKVANGVEMLEIETNAMGQRMVIHPTVLYDQNDAVLIDTGMPGQWDAIREAMEQAGIPVTKLRAVILTHQDIDHIGSIQDVLLAVVQPPDVVAHAEERPYIEGEKPLMKLNTGRMAERLAQLPAEVREKLESIFRNPPSAQVTRVVQDGDVLPLCGGIQVVFTPGHTPGHISLYHIPSKTLIAGDATVAQDGKVLGPNPHATPDMPQALASLKKLAELDIQQLICYHGGLCTHNVAEQIREVR